MIIRAWRAEYLWHIPWLSEGRRMTIEIISWSISTKVWDRAGIKLATLGSAVRLASVARQVIDCATWPGTTSIWKHSHCWTRLRSSSKILIWDTKCLIKGDHQSMTSWIFVTYILTISVFIFMERIGRHIYYEPCHAKNLKSQVLDSVQPQRLATCRIIQLAVKTLKAPRKKGIWKCPLLKSSAANIYIIDKVSIEANSVYPEQTAPIGAVWSGSTLCDTEAS